jgi:hypothetical protein
MSNDNINTNGSNPGVSEISHEYTTATTDNRNDPMSVVLSFIANYEPRTEFGIEALTILNNAIREIKDTTSPLSPIDYSSLINILRDDYSIPFFITIESISRDGPILRMIKNALIASGYDIDYEPGTSVMKTLITELFGHNLELYSEAIDMLTNCENQLKVNFGMHHKISQPTRFISGQVTPEHEPTPTANISNPSLIPVSQDVRTAARQDTHYGPPSRYNPTINHAQNVTIRNHAQHNSHVNSAVLNAAPVTNYLSPERVNNRRAVVAPGAPAVSRQTGVLVINISDNTNTVNSSSQNAAEPDETGSINFQLYSSHIRTAHQVSIT